MTARIEEIVWEWQPSMWQRMWHRMWQRALWLLKSHLAKAAAVGLGLLGFLIWRLGYSSELAVELGGIAITVLVIDTLNERRAEQREKRALILQMGSRDNAFAVEAARMLRVRGWLTDGSLRGAGLWKANLQGANLRIADLQWADLCAAQLQWATLDGADLQWATLGGAELQWATLDRAELQWANLRGARHLETATLDGAKANSETRWPEGFQVPDTVEMVEVKLPQRVAWKPPGWMA